MAMIHERISIRRYCSDDEHQLFSLLEREGEEWQGYWQNSGREKYKKALSSSIAYLLFDDNMVCGYTRCRDDDGYGVYIYDLLVDKAYRGNEYGRLLMEKVCRDFPHDTIYVMSDVNPYYEKLGYEIEGAIFTVKP
jgi:ribosomal protein S18 acetylase RimI-like enzyme